MSKECLFCRHFSGCRSFQRASKKEDYEGALAVVEAVDWQRVKSLRTLGMVADVYEANKRYPEAKKILLMAYDRSSIGKGILYRLVEVSVKMKDFDEAIDFYNEFEAVARHDNSRYLLKYKILRGQKAPLEEQISLLEEYKEREFTERWAYELANLYSKAGETQKCIDACDELILWFSEGKYVTKAMDLKMKYETLSPSQQIKYEHRFDYKKNEEPSEDPEALEVRLAGESGAGEMAATKEPAETPEVKPVNGGVKIDRISKVRRRAVCIRLLFRTLLDRLLCLLQCFVLLHLLCIFLGLLCFLLCFVRRTGFFFFFTVPADQIRASF